MRLVKIRFVVCMSYLATSLNMKLQTYFALDVFMSPGNQNLLQCDSMWRELLTYYRERGCVVPADKFSQAAERTQYRQNYSNFEEEFRTTVKLFHFVKRCKGVKSAKIDGTDVLCCMRGRHANADPVVLKSPQDLHQLGINPRRFENGVYQSGLLLAFKYYIVHA